MRLESACKKYFSCFSTLKHYKEHGPCDNAIAGLCAVTFCTFVIPAAVFITLKACRCFKRVHRPTSPTDTKVHSASAPTLKPVTVNPQKGLDQIGGFFNNGNTCFIASALQALRQIPALQSCFDPHNALTRLEETDERFQLRCNIHSALAKFYKTTEEGKGIQSKELCQFHTLLHEYDSNMISPPGTPGDQSSVFLALMEILGFSNHILLRYCEGFDDHSIKINVENVINSKKSNIPDFFCIARKETKALSKDIPPRIESETAGGEKYTYALVSAMGGTGHHAVAYLKEPKYADWIFCNDDRISRVNNISDQYQIRYLFYAKV